MDTGVFCLLTSSGFEFLGAGRGQADADAMIINSKPQTAFAVLFG